MYFGRFKWKAWTFLLESLMSSLTIIKASFMASSSSTTLANKQIKLLSAVKFLGVYSNRKLTWKCHIWAFVYLVWGSVKPSSLLSQKIFNHESYTTLTLYKALILSWLDYGSISTPPSLCCMNWTRFLTQLSKSHQVGYKIKSKKSYTFKPRLEVCFKHECGGKWKLNFSRLSKGSFHLSVIFSCFHSLA